MVERMIFDTDSDPGMQVVVTGADTLGFSNSDDWCGDTESGLGAIVSVDLNREQVAELHAALGRWLATPEAAQK